MTMKITVRCHAGYKADERPTSYTLEEKSYKVQEVVDRWYDPDANYYRVLTADGSEHLLRHNLEEDEWELVQPASTRKDPST